MSKSLLCVVGLLTVMMRATDVKGLTNAPVKPYHRARHKSNTDQTSNECIQHQGSHQVACKVTYVSTSQRSYCSLDCNTYQLRWRAFSAMPCIARVIAFSSLIELFPFLNCAHSFSQYTDTAGNVWLDDTGFLAGSTYSTLSPISNTFNDPLYQSERYGDVQYEVPMSSGIYDITLHFAEIYLSAPGLRIFDVVFLDCPSQNIAAIFGIVGQVGAFTATTLSQPAQ
jgi:Malectin domain